MKTSSTIHDVLVNYKLRCKASLRSSIFFQLGMGIGIHPEWGLKMDVLSLYFNELL